jgi:hypothetical protein
MAILHIEIGDGDRGGLFGVGFQLSIDMAELPRGSQRILNLICSKNSIVKNRYSGKMFLVAATFKGKHCSTSTIIKMHTRFIDEIFEIDAGIGSNNCDGVGGHSSIDRHRGQHNSSRTACNNVCFQDRASH